MPSLKLLDNEKADGSGSLGRRQDWIIGPSPASSFAGYFAARFDIPFSTFGTSNGPSIHSNHTYLANGTEIAGWATFPTGTKQVTVRIGTSFISVDQARHNLDAEIPDGVTLEETAAACRAAWSEKLDRVRFSGDDAEREGAKWKRVFYSKFTDLTRCRAEATL